MVVVPEAMEKRMNFWVKFLLFCSFLLQNTLALAVSEPSLILFVN